MNDASIIAWSPTVIGLVVALSVGLLIGVERERNKGSGPTREAAGVRTFILVALLGVAIATLDSAILIAVFAFAVMVLAAVSYWRSSQADPGLTTEVALLVTYVLGVLSLSHPNLAAALGVITALLLASRSWLHRFVKQGLSDREMLDGMLLAASALIVLPLLPDHAIDPFSVVNPHLIWRITVVMLLISAVGYIAARIMKNGRGLALAGLLGGFVSSTATISSMAAHSRSSPALMSATVAGAALSSVATIVQLMLVLYLANSSLATKLLPALTISMVVALGYGLLLVKRAERSNMTGELKGRAFELKRAFGFALLITTVMFVSAILASQYGVAGATIGIALAGLADAHSSTAAAASLANNGTITTENAVFTILLAVTANAVSKAVVALITGGRVFGARVILGLVMILIALWSSVAITVGW
ncbi:MAG: MgtC/SapB family protein [Steroidobacteraceae bacterium]